MCFVASMGTAEDNPLLLNLSGSPSEGTAHPREARLCGWCEAQAAVVQCAGCAEAEGCQTFELCGECDRVVHLNKRRRGHVRSVLTSVADEPVTVDTREGCARLKAALGRGGERQG